MLLPKNGSLIVGAVAVLMICFFHNNLAAIAADVVQSSSGTQDDSIAPILTKSPDPVAATPSSAAANVTSNRKPLRLSSIPKSIAGCCLGFIVGTPVCFAKKLPQEAMEEARGFVGTIAKNEDNKYLVGPAFVMCLAPAGLITLLDAPMYSLRNSWMADKPFSKEQFSLTQLDK